jgi:hypothetical protein
MNLASATAPASTCTRHPRILLLIALVAANLALLGPGARPAVAHTHPTPVETDAPAVVRVETSVRVSISLMEHDRHGKHIGLYQRTYTPVLQKGSGFAVNPSGVIVAAGGVIEPDYKKAEVYAVNQIFHDRYGRRAPLPRDPYTRHTIKDVDPTDPLNGRLQRCYRPNTADTTGGCVMASTRLVRVYPFVASQRENGNLTAEVLYPKADKPAAVSVLKVGASSMPTVGLAGSAAGMKAFTALGFTGIPARQVPLVKKDGHSSDPGQEITKDEFLPELVTAVQVGVWGGPVVSERGQTAGFLQLRFTGTRPTGVYLTDAKAIRAALTAANVQAQRGPTDAVFEAALHNYKNKIYGPAIPSFEQTLKLYPGHALATQYLADAKQKQGTAQDQTGRQAGVTGDDGRGGGLPLGLLAVVAALLLILALLFVGARRRGGARKPAKAMLPTARGEASPPATRPKPPTAPREPSRRNAGVWAHESTGVREAVTPPPAVGEPPGPAESHDAPDRRRSPVTTIGQRDPAPEDRPSFCTECGKQLGQEHRFCGFCGHRVG